MAHPVTADTEIPVKVYLSGNYQPGVPEQGPTFASGGQPAEPAHIEDVAAVGLVVEVLIPVPPAERGSHPNGVWSEVDLLEGLDLAARAIVLANVLRCVGERDAEAQLLDAVPYDDGRD